MYKTKWRHLSILVAMPAMLLASCNSVDVHAKLDKTQPGWWDKNGDGKLGFVVIRGEPGHVDSDNRDKWGIITLEREPAKILKATGEPLKVEQTKLDEWANASINDSRFDLGKKETYSNGDFVCLDVKAAVNGTTGGTTWDATIAGQIFNTWAITYENQIDMVFTTDDQTLGGIINQTGWKSLTDNNTAVLGEAGFIPVVGVNAQAAILPYISDKKILGSVFLDSGSQALGSVQLADLLVHKEKPTIDEITKLLRGLTTFDKYEKENKAFRFNSVGITADNIPVAQRSDWSDIVVDHTFEGEKPEDNKGKTVGFVMYNGADSNIGGNFKKGVEQQIAKLGYKAAVVDAQNKQDLCYNYVKSWADDPNCAAIICNIVSQTAGQQIVDLVKNSGKPLIFVNRELTKGAGEIDPTPMFGYDKCYYIGADATQYGKIQGDLLAQYFAGDFI